jgi:hypothetical protein
MNRRDIGNKSWWRVIQKVRQYASSRNRGVVVCDAHIACGGLYYEPNLQLTQSQWNLYCPTTISSGQLLFDFHSMWIGWKESAPCTVNNQPAIFGMQANEGLHGRSLGGISPQGWSCTRNPYLVEFDNSGPSSAVGCNYNMAEDWLLWGWDDISWFALQQEAKRNDILKYAYYKTKCLDINGHLEMPGMRGVSPDQSPASRWLYRANTGAQNQQATIKSIWSNAFASSIRWVNHNFTDMNLINQPSIPHVSSSLVPSGSDRMYYIGTDGYIHGYVKDNGLSGWNTTSPSYSAQSNGGPSIVNQVKAKSDLVVSPDGSTILYIGVDGFIHGFNMISAWNYSYLDFGKQPMLNQNLRAHKNLVFCSNTRLFYVAKEAGGTGNARIHGFVKYGSSWLTTSPTYASRVSAASMEQVGGALTYSPTNNRLYYVGANGFLFYYTIQTDWSFNYVEVSSSQLVAQNIKILPTKISVNGNSVLYIGKEFGNGGALRIHELADNGGNWLCNSPSWAAQSNNQPIVTQMQALGNEICSSPDGKNVACIGADSRVYYYERLANSSWIYSYNKTLGSEANGSASNSLQYLDNYTILYNSTSTLPVPFSTGDCKVHSIKLEEPYCANSCISAIEPSYIFGRYAESVISEQAMVVTEGQVAVYPNPASGIINVVLPESLLDHEITYIVTNSAGSMLLTGSLLSRQNQIDCANLSGGLCVVQIHDESTNIKYFHKVVIEH